MSETQTPPRAAATYVDEDGGEISLPGYLAAVPGIVSPGDTFTFDSAYRVEVFAGERFDEADLDAATRSPHERLTKAQLGEILGVDPEPYAKGDLVTLADDRARMFPPVPGESADPVAESVPVLGQDVHEDTNVDESVVDETPGEGDNA